MSTSLCETDLYAPIRDYLAANGYEVQGEVKRCDIAARKGDELIVVELKRRFSTQLLVQAIDRQKVADSVYVALPGPYRSRHSRRWTGIHRLLRRLELGLIVVTLGPGRPRAEIVFHPLPYQGQRRKARRHAIIKEMSSRTGDYNRGGSVRRQVITAYRENAIHIACCLDRLGPTTPKRLRELGTGPKTTHILSSNFYAWFRRVSRGVYELTPAGRASLASYLELAAKYRELVNQAVREQENGETPEDPQTGEGLSVA